MSKADYPYIVAWGRMMGSFNYYIEAEVAQAAEDGAPRNAIYKRGDVWKTFDEVTNPSSREYVERWLEQMGVEA